MSALVDVADALVDAINGHEWSQSFAAARSMVPEYRLQDMATLGVVVVPRSQAPMTVTRGTHQLECVYDIAVQHRLAAVVDDDIQALMDLVEELIVFLMDRDMGNAQYMSLKNEPAYSVDELQSMLVFTSLVSITYRIQV
jgi:hypothetical protein